MAKNTRRYVSRDPSTNTPLNPPDVPVEEKQRQLEGRRRHEDQAAYIDQSDTDDLGQISTTDQLLGEVEAGVNDDLPSDDESLELLTELELRADETDSAYEASEEGITYVPPIDPPTVPSDDPQGAEIAAGMGSSALDEPYDADHHSDFLPDGDEVSARVREALRADSSTTQYADTVRIVTRGRTVILRGLVDDIDDSDNMVAVAQYVTGIDEVIDELEVRF
jgi:hypothetical protein